MTQMPSDLSRMKPAQHAYIAIMYARAAERAAADVEAQIAHWVTEDRASLDDLKHAREITTYQRRQLKRARARYQRAMRDRSQPC